MSTSSPKPEGRPLPDEGAKLCRTCHPLANLPRTYTVQGWNALQEHFATTHPVFPAVPTPTEQEGDRG